jgi:hypothetical protein
VKLHLASSGGVAGVRLEGQLDTDDLAPEIAAHARRLVDLAAGEEEAATPGEARAADVLQYELTWFAREEPGREVAYHRHFSQSTAPDAALESLQALMREVVRRKAAARMRPTRD